MSDFTFVTTNDIKVLAAKAACDALGISFDRSTLDFVEIQASEGEPIARHKVEQAYAELQKPVVVTDDSWLIPGLAGFPGPYMKQINDWFSVDDWLRLTRDLTDRRMILRQIIAYKDATTEKLFVSDIEAVLFTESRTASGIKHFSIISFDGGAHSAAELAERGESPIQHLPNSWQDLCHWLKTRNT